LLCSIQLGNLIKSLRFITRNSGHQNGGRTVFLQVGIEKKDPGAKEKKKEKREKKKMRARVTWKGQSGKRAVEAK